MRNRGAPWAYIMLSCVSSLSYSMIFTIELVYQARIVGANPLQLALIGSVQQSMNFLFQTPTGILADMYSRRKMVMFGFLLVGTGYLIEGCIPALSAILIATAIEGLGATLVSGADAAWIADEVKEQPVGPVYIRAAQAGSLASLCGIAMSAVLVNVHLNLPIVLGGCLFFALSIVLALIMPERHFTPMVREGRGTLRHMLHMLRYSVQAVRMKPVLLTLLIIAVFSGLFTGGFDRFWPYYLLHDFTLPALGKLDTVTWFCFIEAGIAATNFCGAEIARRRVNTNHHRSVNIALFVAGSIVMVSVLCFALAGQFVLALGAFFVFTTARGPQVSLEQIWMNQHLSSDVRATVFSFRGQAMALAQIIGGPLLGLVAIHMNIRSALFTAGVFLFPVLLLYGRFIYSSNIPIVVSKAEEASTSS